MQITPARPTVCLTVVFGSVDELDRHSLEQEGGNG